MPLLEVHPQMADTAPFFTKTAGAEPLPGYRLIEPLGMGGFGEVWKCEVPGGLPKAIKFVVNDGERAAVRGPAQQELKALEHCKTIRHPFILSMERVELIDGELVIVMELADRSLQDVACEYRMARQAGIPRAELLGYLRETAEVLDFLFHEHGLQHLDIKPQNLFLVSKHVKVADFGLVSSLSERRARAAACGTPLYAAPEVFQGHISQHSDQYSLAIMYQELLTGALPIRGTSPRQLMVQHMTAEPDLETLPPRDRPLVAKALAKDANQRFPSCLEFIHSLMYGKVVLASVTDGAAGLRDLATTPAHGFLDETLPERPNGLHAPPAWAACDSIPGYEPRVCLSRHLLSDLWQVQGPNGNVKQAQLLHAPPYRSAVVVDKLASWTHPTLPVYEILQSPSGRIFLVGEPAEPTLAERYARCRKEGLPGIPRTELIGYLSQVAAALDDLLRDQHLPHLTLQPSHIVLRPERVQLEQFGMAALLWPVQVKPAANLNARYAAPELYEPGFSPNSDQYALALIYAEMLMGMQPRPGRGGGGRGQGKLDIDLLPACDRSALTRALSVDPGQRFASCSDFIRALGDAPFPEATGERTPSCPAVVPAEALAGATAPPGSAVAPVEAIATRWLLAATGATALKVHENLRYLAYPDRSLEHRYPVRIIPGALRIKLHDLLVRWHGEITLQDDHLVVFRMPSPQTFWQRCRGVENGVELRVGVQTAAEHNPQALDAFVRVAPYGPGADRIADMVTQVGPFLIATVRAYLEEDADRRRHERWPCPLALQAIPILPGGSLGERVAATADNISHHGIGFRVSQPLTTETAYVVPCDQKLAGECALLVHIENTTRTSQDEYYIGGRFANEAIAK